jgi:hypothetical protein
VILTWGIVGGNSTETQKLGVGMIDPWTYVEPKKPWQHSGWEVQWTVDWMVSKRGESFRIEINILESSIFRR